MTRIAVIVPCVQPSEHLGACIDSLLAQTCVPDDIIVVTSSAEDAGTIVARYRDHGVHAVAAPHGRAAALNAGLHSTTCDLVAFLDADSVAATDRIEWQLDVFTSHPDIVLSHGALVPMDRRRSGDAGMSQETSQHVPVDQQLGRLIARNHIATGTVCARRDTVIALGGFAEIPGMAAAYDLWLRMATHGRFHYIDAPLAVSLHDDSRRGNDDPQMVEGEGGALNRLEWNAIADALRRAYPDDRERAIVEGEVRLRREEYGPAELHFLSLARQPRAAGALFHLAHLMMRRGSLDYAEAALRRALGDEPDDAALCNNLGVLLARVGRSDEAADAFARALDLEPRYEDAAANLEQILHGQSGTWRVTRTRLRPRWMPLAAAA